MIIREASEYDAEELVPLLMQMGYHLSLEPRLPYSDITRYVERPSVPA
jgi:hypothetical protein